MDYVFRKRKLLKTLLSLSLLFATVAFVQKLKSADGPRLGLGEAAAGAGLAPGGSAARANGSEGPGPSDPPPAWGVTVNTCSQNGSVRGLSWFSALDARFQQYVLYRHCRYFPMLLNHPEKCAAPTHLLIVVKSVIEQHDRRAAVRHTWGRERRAGGRAVRTLFLLGAPAAGKDRRNLQQLLEYEDRLHGDILQWDFMDTFFNLTLKEVNFLRWFHVYCRHTRFVFKGDDDVFVHTDNLLEFLASPGDGPRRDDLFAGNVITRALPIRNHQSKYFIPKQLHDGPYPPYAGGGGFLMAAPLARRLAAASEAVQLYPIDDVYLGMCLQRLGVQPQGHFAFRTFGVVRRRVSPMNSDPCFYKNLLVIHKLSPEGLLQMWDIVHNRTLVCAKKVLINVSEQ